jgi:hypothetical protein
MDEYHLLRDYDASNQVAVEQLSLHDSEADSDEPLLLAKHEGIAGTCARFVDFMHETSTPVSREEAKLALLALQCTTIKKQPFD